MTHDQDVVDLNPSTIYWMDVSDLQAITLKKIVNKGSQIVHTNKIFYTKKHFYNSK
jgi:hypothetical protein